MSSASRTTREHKPPESKKSVFPYLPSAALFQALPGVHGAPWSTPAAVIRATGQDHFLPGVIWDNGRSAELQLRRAPDAFPIGIVCHAILSFWALSLHGVSAGSRASGPMHAMASHVWRVNPG